MKKSTIDIRPFTKQFYRKNKLSLVLGCSVILLEVGTSLFIAWLVQQILDIMSGVDTGFTLLQLFLMSLGVLAVMILASTLEYWTRPRFYRKAIGQYREYVFSELTKKNFSAFHGENSALYISALSNDVNAIETGYLGSIFNLIAQGLLFVAAIVMMLLYSPLLTAIAIGVCLFPLIGSLLAGNRVAKAEKKISDANESYMSTLKDSLTGFSVIKSFRAEAQMIRIFAKSVRSLVSAGEDKRKSAVIVNNLGNLTGGVAQIGVFLVSAYLAMTDNAITAGTVMVFVQMMNYLINPISTIPGYLAERKAAKALLRKTAEALTENVRETGTSKPTVLNKGIEVQTVSFSYEENKPVLNNISAKFEKGKSYALVGASGSGKSTLLNLLMASTHDYAGNILYDENELRQIDSAALYDIISVVQQNVFIFNASIRDNITMFCDFPEKEVERAIALSGLSALIAERGADYTCGENGSGLSGGEKQRISIARSLLKRSQVLLVDEATAALDAQTAFQVSDAILDLEDITRIVVTHDLDAELLKRYDCILTMKNGKITEQGSFEALMAQKGYFYSLYTVSQA